MFRHIVLLQWNESAPADVVERSGAAPRLSCTPLIRAWSTIATGPTSLWPTTTGTMPSWPTLRQRPTTSRSATIPIIRAWSNKSSCRGAANAPPCNFDSQETDHDKGSRRRFVRCADHAVQQRRINRFRGVQGPHRLSARTAQVRCLIMGSTGEVSMLSPEERKLIVSETLKAKTTDMEFWYGCTGPHTDATIDYVTHAAAEGADGAIIAAPAYISTSNADIVSTASMWPTRARFHLGFYNNPPRVGTDLVVDDISAPRRASTTSPFSKSPRLESVRSHSSARPNQTCR